MVCTVKNRNGSTFHQAQLVATGPSQVYCYDSFDAICQYGGVDVCMISKRSLWLLFAIVVIKFLID